MAVNIRYALIVIILPWLIATPVHPQEPKVNANPADVTVPVATSAVAFPELEITVPPDTVNVFAVRFKRSKESQDVPVVFGLGDSRNVIPVLDALIEDSLDYPSPLAIVQGDKELYAVSQTGQVINNLKSLQMSASAMRRIRVAFDEGGQPAVSDSDKGMYQGIVLVFPWLGVPMDTEDAIKSYIHGLFRELLLDKVESYYGHGRRTRMGEVSAMAVRDAQSMLFFAPFLLKLSMKNGAVDLPKFFELMAYPDRVSAEEQKQRYIPVRHKGGSGYVREVKELQAGFMVVIQVREGETARSVEYFVLAATDLKAGQQVEDGAFLGVAKNPQFED